MLIHTVFWGGIFSIIGNWEYYMSYSKTPLVYSAEKSRRVENRSTQKNIRDNSVTKRGLKIPYLFF